MDNVISHKQTVPIGHQKDPGLNGMTDRSNVSACENRAQDWPRYPFRYEDPATPGLAILREKYLLPDVVSGGRSELEQLVLLRAWVKRRWVHAAPEVPGHDRMNALQLLEQAQQGARFYCHHYALTFVQCCLALGWQARLLGIFRYDYGGHNVTEVWVNSLGKWVVMDPDYDCHYECDGIPLHALELHQACGSKVLNGRDIQLCMGAAGDASVQGAQIRSQPLHLIDYYHRFFLFMGNAFFQADPNQPIVAVTQQRLRWTDLDTPEGMSAACRASSGVHLVDTFSSRTGDFYWDMNQNS